MKTAEDRLSFAINALEEHGLLLQSDSLLPNAVSILAGEPVKGSWWAHPQAHQIFHSLNALQDNDDVLSTKLLSGKVTLVHRKLWRDFIPIAMARESWQRSDLSEAATFLLRSVDREGILSSNEIVWPKRLAAEKIGRATRELEDRLLVHGEEFHTEKGAHAKSIETWKHWAARVGFRENLCNVSEGKRHFESLVAKLNKEYGAKGQLPWL